MASDDDYNKATGLIGKTYDSDIAWVTLMNNRMFVSDIVTFIINESDKEDKYTFGGTCILGNQYDNFSAIIDKETIDLVEPNLKPKKGGKNQSLYKEYKDWVHDHPPNPNKSTIYFVGDGHGHSNAIDIHWNVFIASADKKELIWYDPSMEQRNFGGGYNFDVNKIVTVKTAFGNPEIKFVVPPHRAQQFCDDTHSAADVFCQSWVVFFVSAFLYDPTLKTFFALDTLKYQTQPLKMWLLCVLSQMPEWTNTLKRPEFKEFKTYCRTYDCRSLKTDAVKLPKIIPQESRKRKKPLPCIHSVFENF
jgi:hypothetical protein